ncbi:MAG: radical SAM family heme chaperone HemW [Pseudomonadota bacterium]
MTASASHNANGTDVHGKEQNLHRERTARGNGPSQLHPLAPIAIYVHWPYCAKICPYCDFNVRKNKKVDVEPWLTAFKNDLTYWRAVSGPRQLVSIYFGGGTPSLCPPEILSSVIETAQSLWLTDEAIEVTLETNPTDAEQDLFSDLSDRGFNRLSLGVQSFNDDQLNFLGRNHDGASARKAIVAALGLFKNVSFDLIYALPGETPQDWRLRLRDALMLGADHLSAYQLTVEPGTAFERAVNRKHWIPTDDDMAADLFDITQEETSRAGLHAYEISNHARKGARSRHNLAYWRGEDYIGIGPGAHGRLRTPDGRLAIETHYDPAVYLQQAEEKKHGAAKMDILSSYEVYTERLAMGLRSSEGIILNEQDQTIIGNTVNRLVEDGFCKLTNNHLVATENGRRVLNALIAELLSDIEDNSAID